MSRRMLMLIGSLALVVATTTASAATIEVEQIDGRLFSPVTITINVGDTILWRNVSSMPHTTTSGTNGTPDGLFDSLNMDPGATFSFTYDSPGTFPYYCDYHLPDMIGVVEVMAPAGDGIVLKLAKGAADSIALDWAGGLAPYDIARGEIRDLSDLNSIATEPTATTYTDPGALLDPAPFFTYQVTAGGAAAPTLAEVQAAVFTPSCAKSGCHEASFPAMGMDLSDGNAHANIVGIASAQQPGVMRIAPGDPALSYLVLKVEDDPSIDGSQMPRDGPPFLTPDQIAMLRAWVTDGAQNN